MSPFVASGISRLKANIFIPGDKSISHRAVILSALSQGKTRIRNFSANEDCFFTLEAFKKLGLKVRQGLSVVTVYGRGLSGLKKSRGPIFAGNSGTTMRLLLGVLAGQDFPVKLTAGKSLSRRPMLRVTVPLRKMGAEINARRTTHDARPEECPPIFIKGGNLRGITYRMPVASAQVKSALLLAGLFARGETKVIEPLKTRDHTERMLKLFKADIRFKNNYIIVKGGKKLVSPREIYVPGDISSAAFFMVLAAILPHSSITIKNVGLNPSRTGIIRVLKRMGAKIQVPGARCQVPGAEPMGDITVRSSKLKGVTVSRKEIPSLIDELPILMVAASLARGKTIFQGVGELRVKETDRVKSMRNNLTKMGAKIKVERSAGAENIVIEGVGRLRGAKVKSYADHRTAMSMVVAGLVASGTTRIDDVSCINKSFPEFLRILKSLGCCP